MKIVEVSCKKCKAKYETLSSIPRDRLKCPACGGKEFNFKETDRNFEGCGGSCGGCTSCK